MTKDRKVGSKKAVKARLWKAVTEAERILKSPDSTPELKLKAIHCLSTVTGQYLKVCDLVDQEERLLFPFQL